MATQTTTNNNNKYNKIFIKDIKMVNTDNWSLPNDQPTTRSKRAKEGFKIKLSSGSDSDASSSASSVAGVL